MVSLVEKKGCILLDDVKSLSTDLCVDPHFLSLSPSDLPFVPLDDKSSPSKKQSQKTKWRKRR